MQEKPTKTSYNFDGTTISKKRNIARQYSVNVQGQKHNVCKKFFLKTLDVGERYVDHALKNKTEGVFGSSDRRGKHVPHNKTSEKSINFVKQHIESFPTVDAHYTRKDTRRKFLGQDLNIKKMYDEYVKICKESDPQAIPVSTHVYRNIFNTEYNYSFHIPKKDQCDLCFTYRRETNDGKNPDNNPSLKEKYDCHQKRKVRAREEKQKDKMTAEKSDSKVHVATFDLEAVLYTPCTLASQLYYKRKLSTYNLSVYSLANHKATCFMWNETEGMRGSCEIGTCLSIHIKSLPASCEHVILFSDTCTGQNRNQFIAAALVDTLSKSPNIKIIDQKFLESGHTHMECDSMHAAIEFAKRKTTIYVPSQWDTVVRMARRSNPYLVVPLKHTAILDFKSYATNKFRNTEVSYDEARVQWMKLKWLRFLSDEPDKIYFKYDF